MPYVEVPEAITGAQAYTADFLNTYLKNNLAAMAPDIFTTKGSLFVGIGADAGLEFPIGPDNRILVANSDEETGLDWAGFDRTFVYNRVDFGETTFVWPPAWVKIDYGFTYSSSDFDGSSIVKFDALESMPNLQNGVYKLSRTGMYLAIAKMDLACTTDYYQYSYSPVNAASGIGVAPCTSLGVFASSDVIPIGYTYSQGRTTSVANEQFPLRGTDILYLTAGYYCFVANPHNVIYTFTYPPGFSLESYSKFKFSSFIYLGDI